MKVSETNLKLAESLLVNPLLASSGEGHDSGLSGTCSIDNDQNDLCSVPVCLPQPSLTLHAGSDLTAANAITDCSIPTSSQCGNLMEGLVSLRAMHKCMVIQSAPA